MNHAPADPAARCPHCGCPETLDPDAWKRPINRAKDWAIIASGMALLAVGIVGGFMGGS